MELNRRNIRLVLGIITFTVILVAAASNLDAVLDMVRTLWRKASFFIIGASAAFILDVPLRFFERRLLPALDGRLGERWRRMRRPLGLVLTGLMLAAILCLIFFLIIPEIGKTFVVLEERFPAFAADAGAWFTKLMDSSGQSLDAMHMPQIDWVKIGDTLLELTQGALENFAANTVSMVSSIVFGVINLALGLVIAFYILYQKEKLGAQVERVLHAFVPEKAGYETLRIGQMARATFSSFIRVQFLEAIILGALCFLGMTIFGFPFAPLISLLVGVLSVVPIFGALIGLLVGAFMILVNNGLSQAGLFALFFFVLQQAEGGLIYPHVVGKSVKLPGLWILTAATLGGNVAGIAGMLVSVPLASLLYALLREAVDRRNEANPEKEE